MYKYWLTVLLMIGTGCSQNASTERNDYKKLDLELKELAEKINIRHSAEMVEVTLQENNVLMVRVVKKFSGQNYLSTTKRVAKIIARNSHAHLCQVEEMPELELIAVLFQSQREESRSPSSRLSIIHKHRVGEFDQCNPKL